MGMESFTFDIVCDKQITKESILDCVNRVCNIRQYFNYSTGFFFKKKVIDSDRYILNNSIVFDIRTNSQNTIVSVEACFANYSHNIMQSFKLYEILKTQFNDTSLRYGDISLEKVDNDETYDEAFTRFQKWLSNTHIRKHDAFVGRYGELQANILPSEFYEFVRKNKL